MTNFSKKIGKKYFDAVNNEIKTHEVRRMDEDYRVGDTLILREWLPGTIEAGSYSGRVVSFVITHILTHSDYPDGIKEGYAVLSIKKLHN